MYTAGQFVRYGTNGICRIEEITTREFAGEKLLYYVLKPIGQESATLYVPVHNEKLVSRMQRLLSAQEIEQIIGAMKDEQSIWITEDVKRRQFFSEILQSGDRLAMARMIKALFLRRQELLQKRKKLHMADERLLKEAERVLYEEFAYVLDIEENKVMSYIQEKLKRAGEASLEGGEEG